MSYVVPKFIVSDTYMKFDFQSVKGYEKALGITCKHVADFHPRGNAKVERMVGGLKKAIKKIALSKSIY